MFTSDKGVKGPKNLEGKTFIGKRRPLPELELITDAMLKVYGVDASRVKVVGTTNTGQAIIENTALMKTYHRDLAHWNAKNSLINVQLPFHNGAIKYFKEKGLWTPALEATQKRLLQ